MLEQSIVPERESKRAPAEQLEGPKQRFRVVRAIFKHVGCDEQRVVRVGQWLFLWQHSEIHVRLGPCASPNTSTIFL